ncbi:MAG: hypothetical protein CYPHOPRED_003662 [Cyphobasidiales sp. Tagirdzhanova-0007]|nr:MAG: hypothetical protein CYPHOPRED_003662 [Cyphobasidiales sp. Tagirdzhanova-0007]
MARAYSPPSSVDARSCDEEASSTGPSTSGPLTPTSADSTSQQSRKNSSPLSSPLPSPALIPYHGLLDNKPRPLNDDAKTPVIGSEGASAGFTHAERKPPSDYENMLLSLSSRKQLRAMLDDPVGLWKFGQFLASEMNAETLVFWLNAEQHRNDLKRLYSLTQRIHSLHIPSNAPLALNLTSSERGSIERAIRSFTKADDPFKVARDTAFQALYHDAWPRFLQWRLELLQSKLRAGGLSPPPFHLSPKLPSHWLIPAETGISHFCLSGKSKPLNDGFLDLTGYSRADVLMQNCRFLQGPGTSAAKITRIRQACTDGTEVTELLLNYRKDGVPFWSLLRIIPLRNASGKLKYLLGCQINVTNVLAATADLAHLLADDLDIGDMCRRPPYEHDMSASQRADTGEAMRSYLTALDRQNVSDAQKKVDSDKFDASKALLNNSNFSPMPHSAVNSPSHSTATSTPRPGSPAADSGHLPNPPIRPRSANRDMHLHAAAALAFDGTMGNVASKGPMWTGLSGHTRPQTSSSLFQRPGTSYTMVDAEGKEQAQLSLAEQTRAFNEASSHYVILDSAAQTVLFHSPNFPAGVAVGSDFPALIGSKVAKRIKDQTKTGERLDIDAVSLNVSPSADPMGIWRANVKFCVTPLKDQIDEVGAVIILIQSSNAAA